MESVRFSTVVVLFQFAAILTGASPYCSRTDDTPCMEVPNCAVGSAVAKDFKITNVPGIVPARQQTVVSVCWDHSGLHVNANASEQYIFSPYTKCNSPVFINGDVMELFVAPVYSATDNPIFYHEVDTGAAGALFATLINNTRGNATDCECCVAGSPKCIPGNLPCTGRDNFAPSALSVTVANGTEWWSYRLFVPWNLFPAEFQWGSSPLAAATFSTVTNSAPTAFKPWPVFRANFYRYDYPDGPEKPYELSGWSPTHDPSFHVPARFGTLVMV